MNKLSSALVAIAIATCPQVAPAAAAPVATSQTVTGIPLDATWRGSVYAFARSKLLHPAWGWTHSERDYQLASQIAAREELKIDRDVLFAAAFLHDVGAIGDFQKEGVDHAVRSAELAGPILLSVGFPADKIPAVREAILGHMHDKTPGKSNESVVLHDADTVDFLGAVGVARRLAVTGSATAYDVGIARIREFADRLPGRVVTATARQMAMRRAAEMKQFLDQLTTETGNGRIP